tara:strand:- start:7923 stop:8363 length:441 start_codon:yes stop_codon:yes gene_type:complete
MEAWEIWPEQAYVPGQTPRHPECTFDLVRDTARAGLDSARLAESRAFQLGLKYQKFGFYWEAHEVFEPVWMVLPEPSVERQFVQGLIQIANGYLKMKMNRPKAALRLAHIARDLLPMKREGLVMGVVVAEMHLLVDHLEQIAGNAI